MTAIPSVARAEQLVKQLYLPGFPDTIRQISDELLQLQLSPDGWKIADELMLSNDHHVRFYAALTFTIKLNTDGHSLDPETAQTVLTRLIYWLVRLVQQDEGALVCQKLCSTLGVYFIRSPLNWERPILEVARSLASQDACTLENVLPMLGIPQLKALLWFADSLAEEVGKMDSNLSAYARSHKEMESAVIDASKLMEWSLSQIDRPGAQDLRTEALRTFLTWVNYAQPVWPRNEEPLQYLRDLIERAAQCLLDLEIREEALETFRDVLESYTTFFQPVHVEMMSRLICNQIRPALTQALAEQDPQAIPLAELVIAFGSAYIDQVVQDLRDEQNGSEIIQVQFQILSTPGFPGDEDELSIRSIEFWNTYIEFVNDSVYSLQEDDVKPAWIPHAKDVTQRAVELLWRKMWIPPSDVQKGWTDSESEAFKEFRLDALDTISSMFVFLGSQMLHQLVSYAVQSLQSKEWRGVEATLLCLNTLADEIVDDESRSNIVSEVFRSSLFREIADFTQTMPLQTRRTAIDLLGSYGQYIERHTEFLPDSLRFLFASLEVGSLANAAAKAISSLCSACRASLTGELKGFLGQYQQFLASGTADSYTKEKVVGAIAAIIQALSSDREKAAILTELIQHIEKDIVTAQESAQRGDLEMAESMGVTALECLASIGKGLQVPDDVPICLYDDDESSANQPSYWSSGEGHAIQQRIIGCFSALHVVGNSSAGIEAACQVLRSGLTETEPGPFVLPPSIMVSFLQQCSVHTPQLETVLSTAGMLITQHSRKDSTRIDADVAAIYGCVLGFAQTLGQAPADPVTAMGCINVFTRIMPHYTHILLGSQVADVLEFSISAMRGPDNFPKRSAAEFWTKLIKPQTAAVSTDVQQSLAQVMQAYGPGFTDALMHQIGGLAQRSDLDFLYEPLKALLLHQQGIQNWLQQILLGDGFRECKVSVEHRQRFIRQLLGIRGDGRLMRDIVKTFWANCRGTVVSY